MHVKLNKSDFLGNVRTKKSRGSLRVRFIACWRVLSGLLVCACGLLFICGEHVCRVACMRRFYEDL